MKIDDLLSIVGDNRLVGFKWGPRLVDVINFHGDGVHRVFPDNSGIEARVMIRSMTLSRMELLFSLDFNVETGEVEESEDTPPIMGGNQAEPAPEPISEPIFDVPVAGPAETQTDPITTKEKVSIGLALLVAVLTVIIVTVVSVTSIQSGQMQDASAAEGMAGTIAEIIKALLE